MAFTPGGSFGAQSASAFGSASLFGTPSAPERQLFGAGTLSGGGNGLFGAASSAPAFGSSGQQGFGTPNTAIGTSGSLFGSATSGSSAFGATTTPTPTFGAAVAPKPAFGQQQSFFGSSAYGSGQQQQGSGGFGGASSGLFGAQPQQSSTSLFGSQAPGTSASSSGFGGSSGFGQQPAFFGGGSSFGGTISTPGSGLFGASTAQGLGATGSFGQQSAPSAFGSANPSGSSLFGSGSGPSSGLFGQPSAQAGGAFGGAGVGSFGPSSFGSSGPSYFGNSGGVSVAGERPRGTSGVKWSITNDQEGVPPQPGKFHTITMMPNFRDRSLEELRIEDYSASTQLGSVNGASGLLGSSATGQGTSSLFSHGTVLGSSSVGNGVGLFGSAGNVPLQGSSFFGSSGPQTTTGFGSTAFGSASGSGFGAGGQKSGLFGASQSSAFSQPSGGGLFGTPTSGPGVGGSSAIGSSLFGGGASQSAGAFSQQPSFGGFQTAVGNSQPSLFGGQPGSLFSTSSAPQSQSSLFGGTGTVATQSSMFNGSLSVPSVGAGGVFGNTSSLSGSHPTIFGGSSLGVGTSGLSSNSGLTPGIGFGTSTGSGLGAFGLGNVAGISQSGAGLGGLGMNATPGLGLGSVTPSINPGLTSFGSTATAPASGGAILGAPTTGFGPGPMTNSGQSSAIFHHNVGAHLPPLIASLDVNPFGPSIMFNSGLSGSSAASFGKSVSFQNSTFGGSNRAGIRRHSVSIRREPGHGRFPNNGRAALLRPRPQPFHFKGGFSLFDASPVPFSAVPGYPQSYSSNSTALSSHPRVSRAEDSNRLKPAESPGNSESLWHGVGSALYPSLSRVSLIKKLVIRSLQTPADSVAGVIAPSEHTTGNPDGESLGGAPFDDTEGTGEHPLDINSQPQVTSVGSTWRLGHNSSDAVDDIKFSGPIIRPTPMRPSKDEARLSDIDIQGNVAEIGYGNRVELKSEDGDGTDREQDVPEATDDEEAAQNNNETVGYVKSEPALSSLVGPSYIHQERGRERTNPLAPICTLRNVFTRPSLRELAVMDDESLTHVSNFTIGMEGIGEVVWPGDTDVRGVNIDMDFCMKPREVVVYPQDERRPEVGSGLNKRAQVRLEGLWKIDKMTRQPLRNASTAAAMVKKLKAHCDSENLIFLGYDISTGSWMFETDHF